MECTAPFTGFGPVKLCFVVVISIDFSYVVCIINQFYPSCEMICVSDSKTLEIFLIKNSSEKYLRVCYDWLGIMTSAMVCGMSPRQMFYNA